MKKHKLTFVTFTYFILVLASTIYCVLSTAACAEVLERIVAVVNDDVILLSEFKEATRVAEDAGKQISDEAVLNEMINRKLLLKEAVSFRLDDPRGQERAGRDDDYIIKRSIDRRIRAFIHIPYEEIESYYMKHQDLFSGRELYDVRDEIEKTLIEEKMSARLDEYIKTLRDKSYIRIQLKEDD